MPAASAPSASNHLPSGLTPASCEQDRQRHAGPVRARHEAVQRTGALLRGLGGVHAAAVARALEELNARHERIARQRVEAEHERPLDEPVDQHAVLLGVDVRDAVVVTLEVQRVRRDDAFEMLERRARAAGAGRRRRAVREPLHLRFEVRALAVAAGRRAGRLHRGGHFERRRGRVARRQQRHAGAEHRGALRQEQAAMQQAVAGHGFEWRPLASLLHFTFLPGIDGAGPMPLISTMASTSLAPSKCTAPAGWIM